VPATNPQDVADYAPWQTPLSPPPAPEQAPKEGWRAALYGLSGRRLNLGLSTNERRVDAWLRTIDTPVTNHTIATMNVKGGAGKTTTTIAMGTAFAMHRRDQCIGIDANPDRGNLAQRLGQEHLYTIRDLLDNLDEITGAHTLRKFTNQAHSRFEVIASDRDPVKARAFTPHEYRTVQQVVRAFRQVVLTDTGIDLTNPVVDAVLQSTDTLVIAVEQRGFDHLVQRAVVSIIKEPSGDQVPLAELRSAFQDRCRAVVVIPNDRSLVGGGSFNWNALNGGTRRAYLELAARVAEDFNTSRPW
jgi:MinD-like ATPase involved in chromosome partitioning or flagellar assembly